MTVFFAQGQVALAALAILTAPATAFLKLSGPFVLDIKYIDKCEDQGTGQVLFSTRFHKRSPTEYMYNGPWVWPYDVDETMSTRVEAAKWGTRGWGLHAFSFSSDNPCADAVKMCPSMFKSITAAGNMSQSCPIRAGKYMIKNWVLNMDLPVDELMYGKFRVDVIFTRKKIRIGCIRVVLTVTEKLLKKSP